MPFMLNTIKQRVAYRASAIGWVLVPAITFFVTYGIWKAVFSSAETTTLSGFTFKEMAVYVCLQAMISLLVDSNAGWSIGGDVVRGDIASSLIKPISYSGKIFAEDLGDKVFILCTVAAPLLLVIFFLIGFPFNLTSMSTFFLSVFLGSLINFFFDICFGMLAFYVTYIWGLQMAKYAVIRFLSGTMIPIAFFSESFQNVFRYLPFQYIAYSPAMVFLGKYSIHQTWFIIGIQLIWIGILYAVGKLLWVLAIKRLTILGG